MTSPQGTPLVVTTRAELAGVLAPTRMLGDRVALVPTMGALHEGHASLMRLARERNPEGPVVVSVFVNPLQFGPAEDLARYPRTLDADVELCAREGVDVVFAPGVDEVYPDGDPQVTVEPGPVATVLEGASRPGHFRGVLTVVAKLFGLVEPDLAVFGEKDYQQLALIRRMSADLFLGVEVVGAPTLRAEDGLALSSRNRYLSEAERHSALAISRALAAAAAAAGDGAAAAMDAATGVLGAEPGVAVDYVALTAPDLAPLPVEVPFGTSARMLIAAKVGSTRLIDNAAILIGG